MISTVRGIFNLNNFDQSSRANDVIVIQHRDGSLHSTPFNVRFGKAKLWNRRNRVVQIEVNGVLTSAVMKIGDAGEAYWLQPTYGHFKKSGAGAGEVALQVAVGTERKNTEAQLEELLSFSMPPESPIDLDNLMPDLLSAEAVARAKEEDDRFKDSSISSNAAFSETSIAPEDALALAGKLVEKTEDGGYAVRKDAIHSAEDAQNANMALRAIAAAEKSRRRLSKFLITNDAFLLNAAWEEGVDDLSPSAPRHPSPPPVPHPQQSGSAEVVWHQTAAATSTLPAAEALLLVSNSNSLPDAASARSASSDDIAFMGTEDDAYALAPLYDDDAEADDGADSFVDTQEGSLTHDDPGHTLPVPVAEPAQATAGIPTTPTGASPSPGADFPRGTPVQGAGRQTALDPRSSSPSQMQPKEGAAPLTRSSPTAETKAATDGPADEDVMGPDNHRGPEAAAAAAVGEAAEGQSATAYFLRSAIPVGEDLWKLNLQPGCNRVRYLTRNSDGTEAVVVSSNIFLWDCTDRLVVSDIDGTITKSDLWGHFYAMLGKGSDWTHPGICSLFSKVDANGYRMVYLTARSVTQINQTKKYLWSLEQEGARLPLGPVLTVPQRFFTALTQEVSKQSHVFKIACLTSLRAAFPQHSKPFFAGFGNRYNDVISYDAVGIPTHKIFIIDPSSVLHVCQVKQTYRNLAHLVDVTFPPVRRRRHHHYNFHHHRHSHEHSAMGIHASSGNGGAPSRLVRQGSDSSSVWSEEMESVGGGRRNGPASDGRTYEDSDGEEPLLGNIGTARSAFFNLQAGGLSEAAADAATGSSPGPRLPTTTTTATRGGGSANTSINADLSPHFTADAPGHGPSGRHNQHTSGGAMAAGGMKSYGGRVGGGGAPVRELSLFDGGDDVPLDVDFNTYNFWRVNPADLISSVPAATGKGTPAEAKGKSKAATSSLPTPPATNATAASGQTPIPVTAATVTTANTSLNSLSGPQEAPLSSSNKRGSVGGAASVSSGKHSSNNDSVCSPSHLSPVGLAAASSSPTAAGAASRPAPTKGGKGEGSGEAKRVSFFFNFTKSAKKKPTEEDEQQLMMTEALAKARQRALRHPDLVELTPAAATASAPPRSPAPSAPSMSHPSASASKVPATSTPAAKTGPAGAEAVDSHEMIVVDPPE